MNSSEDRFKLMLKALKQGSKFRIYSEDAIVYGNYTERINPFYAQVIDAMIEEGQYPSGLQKEPLRAFLDNAGISGPLSDDTDMSIEDFIHEISMLFGDRFQGFYRW